MSKKTPTVESSKIVHRGFFDLRIDTIKRDDGQTMEFTTLLTKTEGVCILAQTTDKKWILTQEYRHSIGQYVLGIPGGRVEKGENFLQCAQRELLEKTGFWAGKIFPLGSSYPIPSVCDQQLQYFFAPCVEKKKEPNLDPFEYIEILTLSQQELEQKMQNRANIDGALLTALYCKKLFSF